MAELKTKRNEKDAVAFLDEIQEPQKKQDCLEILALMKEVTGEQPVMWGDSIIGFGTYTYRYASGHGGDWPITAFSPRKQNITIYIMPGFERYTDLMSRLGKHSIGKSCLYIKRLTDIDLPTLRELVRRSVEEMKKATS